jgi:lambda family phage tail tape measure protein
LRLKIDHEKKSALSLTFRHFDRLLGGFLLGKRMTEERRIQLVAEVDATGTRAGFNEISREAGAMAASVERASQQAGAAVTGVGSGAGSASRNVEAAQRNLIGSIQRTTAAMEAGSRTGAAYYEILARQRGVDPAVLEPYLAQLRAVEATQTRANAALGGAAAPLRQVGVSAAQTAAALRGVPAQFTDIATSLQGGQSPMTVLFQQGGQLRDMFGSTGAAARALGGYVVGLVTPFTVAAAGAAALAFAYKRGRDEVSAFNLALITSGNVAGATADQLSETARNIAQVSGSRGDSAAALNGLVQTGQVQAQNLKTFAQVAIDAHKVMGKSVEQTTADFEKLGKAPLQGLAEISAKFHNVTAATYAQVKALQDQGRYAEAANVAQQAYADGIAKNKQAVLDSLTDWERGWIRIKNGIGGAVDGLLNLREKTDQQKIGDLLKDRSDLEENLRRAKARGLEANVAEYQAELNANERAINKIRDRAKAEKDAAAATAAGVKADELRNKWLSESDVLLTRQEKLQRDLNAARAEGLANGLSEEEILKRQTVIRRQNYDIVVEGIDKQIEALKRQTAIEDLLAQRTLSRIAAERAAGSITEEGAINQSAAVDLAKFDKQRKQLEGELALAKLKLNSQKEQSAAQTDIDKLDEQRTTRELQRGYDLAALARKRASDTEQSYIAGVTTAAAERDGVLDQIKVQREYNEEIGLSSTGIMDVRSARLDSIASLKDESAAALEAIDPGSQLAKIYREQADGIRGLSAAEREGFVKTRDPWVGLSASVRQYADDASNSGRQIGEAMTNAFRGAEDAFATFVTTGKLSFRSLANSILADLARIEARQAIAGLISAAAGSNWVGNLFNVGPSTIGDLSGARANGGPVSSGLSYLVGEKGPEVFTPNSNGTIIPNHEIGGGGITVNTNVNVQSGGATSQTTGDASGTGRALAEMINSKVKEVLVRETRQGGILWNSQQGRA